MKNTLLAFCGVDCTNCEIFIATQENNFMLKEKIAKKISSSSYKITTDEINCYGCSGNQNIKFKFCNSCKIRECGIENKLNNCGECVKYPCCLLTKAFEMDQTNKIRLDKIKNRK